MRLIDADALKLSHCKECTLYPNNCLGDDCDWGSIAHINMMPTVDAVPVIHGKWIDEWSSNGTWLEQKCSECGVVFEDEPRSYRYCPNCGARMDEERKEE